MMLCPLTGRDCGPPCAWYDQMAQRCAVRVIAHELHNLNMAPALGG